ncbi:hypothetical protein A2837_02300 [Candidatus Kaiserbacteria bacterium RIFCSPHIGHO2_01_FULL_46_22]|uniref:Uncharacterized protein n=1 Tax=Candidatus Kaiserbacteria bacterium RIFCSPHIGHO2_01_FULL_46_22 TaxID=1798475 RepID=A0A1F6BYI5_9BACT|nr:MAG: hypothetical protein A2837_02300 [Candidatus Kaiserbacteria bacterium RIFCSPHIGHO2_01_FULL_46_22]
MYIKAAEFESAFVEVEKMYPNISRDLAESFISKLGDAVRSNQGQPFGELLRLALNDSHIWQRTDREPYKVLAGKFFGRRGGHAAHKKSAPKQVTPKRSPAKPAVAVIERPNGQLAWKI